MKPFSKLRKKRHSAGRLQRTKKFRKFCSSKRNAHIEALENRDLLAVTLEGASITAVPGDSSVIVPVTIVSSTAGEEISSVEFRAQLKLNGVADSGTDPPPIPLLCTPTGGDTCPSAGSTTPNHPWTNVGTFWESLSTETSEGLPDVGEFADEILGSVDLTGGDVPQELPTATPAIILLIEVDGSNTVEGDIVTIDFTIPGLAQPDTFLSDENSNPLAIDTITSAQITFTAGATNSPPNPANANGTPIPEDSTDTTTILHTVDPNDTDAGDAHTFSIVSGNGTGGGAFQIDASGNIRLNDPSQLDEETPAQSEYNLVVEVDDGTDTGTATITIDITDVNEAPSIDTPTGDFSLDENDPGPKDLGDPISVTDEDVGDTATYAITSHSIGGGAPIAGSGDFSIDASGQISFSGTAFDFEALTVGMEEVELTVEVTDTAVSGTLPGGTMTDTATVTIPIVDINEAPTANPDPTSMPDANYTTDENVMLTVSAANGVLANDTDPDTTAAFNTLSVVGAPSSPTVGGIGGTVNLSADGSFEYTPPVNMPGIATFEYEVTDGTHTAGPVTVAIVVSDVDGAPTAANVSTSTPEETLVQIDVLNEPGTMDPDGDPLQIVNVNLVTAGAGTVAINDFGTVGDLTDDFIDFTPATNFVGTVEIEYQVQDTGGLAVSTPATITVDVTNIDDPPVAMDNPNNQTTEDNPITIDVLGNDSDGDAAPLGPGADLQIDPAGFTGPTNGTVAVVGGMVQYTPDPGYNGTDSFTYTIFDANDSPRVDATATVSLTIQSVNDPPVAQDDDLATDEDMPLTGIDVLADNGNGVDSDPEGNTLSINSFDALTVQGGNVTLDTGTGLFTYTPPADFNGTDMFTYEIADGLGGFDSATVTVTVAPIADPPTAVDDTILTNTVAAIGIDPLIDNGGGVDFDPDNLAPALPGDGLTVIGIGGVAGDSSVVLSIGTVDFTGGVLTFTPNGTEGADSFAYAIEDPDSNTATGTVTIVATESCTVQDGSHLYVFGNCGDTDTPTDDIDDRIIVNPVNGGGVQIDHRTAGFRTNFPGVSSVEIYGYNGDDRITVASGTPADVTIHGGDGSDYLAGGPGNDEIHGGAGNDRIHGATGNDTLYGDDGVDRMYGGDGNDTMYGGLGDDQMGGASGNDTMFGGDGRDAMAGGTGSDVMFGEMGNDEMSGEDGNDALNGGEGSDRMYGRQGQDILVGGGGSDAGRGGSGSDAMYGGNLTFANDPDDFRAALNAWANQSPAPTDVTDRFMNMAMAGYNMITQAVDDGVADCMTGDAGDDVHFYNANDELFEMRVAEVYVAV